MTIDLGTPTHYADCPRDDCYRKVGPYFDPAEARKAMNAHLDWRHENFYLSDGVT